MTNRKLANQMNETLAAAVGAGLAIALAIGFMVIVVAIQALIGGLCLKYTVDHIGPLLVNHAVNTPKPLAFFVGYFVCRYAIVAAILTAVVMLLT